MASKSTSPCFTSSNSCFSPCRLFSSRPLFASSVYRAQSSRGVICSNPSTWRSPTSSLGTCPSPKSPVRRPRDRQTHDPSRPATPFEPMPTKRTILANLTTTELRTAVDNYELQVDDRRVRVKLIDALVRSRRARIDEILQALKRDRLKAICRTLDLDDGGREKAEIVARLVGGASTSHERGKASPRSARGAAAEKAKGTTHESERRTRPVRPERTDREPKEQYSPSTGNGDSVS